MYCETSRTVRPARPSANSTNRGPYSAVGDCEASLVLERHDGEDHRRVDWPLLATTADARMHTRGADHTKARVRLWSSPDADVHLWQARPDSAAVHKRDVKVGRVVESAATRNAAGQARPHSEQTRPTSAPELGPHLRRDWPAAISASALGRTVQICARSDRPAWAAAGE